jgi:iron complex transport system permease protein
MARSGIAQLKSGLPAMLLVLLLLEILISAGIGAAPLPLRGLFAYALGKGNLTPDQHTILWAIRMPRIFAAVIVGSCLSVAGLLFQGLFRNPLADPYVIGSSGGAVLGASLGIFVLPAFSFAGFSAIALMACAGSLGTIVLVYWLASANGRTPTVSLLLAGFAVGTMLSFSAYFLETLDRHFGAGMHILSAWLHGAIAQPTWAQLAVAAIALIFAYAASMPLARRLNTLALGEEYALHLGVSLQQTRGAVILIGSILTAVAVSLGGLIGFIGLIVPHTLRLILGSDHVRLLPASAIAGGVFLLLADTAARTAIAPSEIPVGVLTAMIGGPFFLYLLRKARREVLS